ncbi:MAG: histidine triad nucleotide-binding protein [Bacteroidetes bacterium]|nr:histidine triad nucleotide-binding protein [Bacteroidota bacterium]
MADSIFKKIYNKEIPSEIIYEDNFVFAINDINPIAPVHILVIPKEQIPTINDINADNEAIIGKIVLAAKHIAKQQGVAENGYRLVFNCNADGGQTVFHIHCHLLAGKKLIWNA